jgi:hypothetical protein
MKRMVGLVCMLAVALLVVPGVASAATRTWDGGCGGEAAWSCAANWSGNVVPAAGDTVTFNGTSTNNSTVDAGFGGSIATVKVNAGYTGTITLARSLAVSTAFTQTAGSFTAAGQALTLKTLTLTGGSFTASSGTTSLSGALAISGSPTFSANGGTFSFGGTGNATLSCGGVGFNLVLFAHTGGTKTVGSNCTLPLGADPNAAAGGSIALNGALSGSGTLTTGKTFTLSPTGSLVGFSGLQAATLTVNGEYDLGAYESLAVSGPLTIAADSDFTAPSGSASLGDDLTIAPAAAFDANGGTLRFVGAAPHSLSCGSQPLSLVVFESTGHKTVGSDCTLPLGTDPDLGKGGTTLYGTLAGDGTLTQTGTFEVESASPGLEEFTDVTDVGSLLLGPAAVLTAPSGTLTVQGNFTVGEGASFDANGGTVDFQAQPMTTKTISCGEATFNLVTLTNVSKQVIGADCTLPLGSSPTIGDGGQIVVEGELTGSGPVTADTLRLTLGLSGSLTGFSGIHDFGDLLVEGPYDFGAYSPLSVLGDLTIAETGDVVAPAISIKLFGDFINNGTFDANEGAVFLLGTEQALVGSTTFSDLSREGAGAGTLVFQAGATQTVEGTLNLEGDSEEEPLNLLSSESEIPWLIAANGAREVRWVSVADSTNEGAAISAVESEDAGGNTGWSFP